MIRKSGWLVFLVMLAAVLALVYLLAGPAIRVGMVYTLEKAAGAEVNIDKVALSLAPLSLEIRDLQITDREQPTRNVISFSEARAAVAVWPALLGYYVMDDLTVAGLAYGSERTSAGKVYRGDNADAEERLDLTDALRLDIPDANELLARLDPQTPAKGAALRELLAEQQQQLNALRAALPRAEKLSEIQAQIKALTDSKVTDAAELANKAEQLKALKETLQTERDKLRQGQQELAQMRAQLQKAVEDVRAAGAADWEKLQKLANIQDGGLAPLSEILLGQFWGEKIAQLESLYRLTAPYIPAAGGKGAAEAETSEPVLPNRILPLPRQPYPDFWIKNARVNWLVGGGEATITLRDITAQHHIIDTATRFSLDARDLPQLAAITLEGDFAILQQMVTNLSWQLEGLQLDSFALGGGENSLTVSSGVLASTGSLKLVDRQINQQAQMLLQQAEITASGNRYLQQLAQLLDSQPEIPLNLGAEGLVSAPAVSVRSPLDKLVGDALLGEAKAKLAGLEQQLRGQVDEELKQQLGGQSQWLTTLDDQDAELESLNDRIEEMLNAKLGDVKSEAKDRLKDALLKRREAQ